MDISNCVSLLVLFKLGLSQNQYSAFNPPVVQTTSMPSCYRRPIAVAQSFTSHEFEGKVVSYISEIVLIDDNERVLLKSSVRQPGKAYDKEDESLSFYTMKQIVIPLLQFRLVIGNDLRSLYKELHYAFTNFYTRDVKHLCSDSTCHLEHSFETVAKECLNVEIDGDNKTEEAVVSMRIYKQYKSEWSTYLLQDKPVVAIACDDFNYVGADGRNWRLILRIVIVNMRGMVIYDKLLKPSRSMLRISKKLTKMDNFESGYDVSKTKMILENLLRGYIIVGHEVSKNLAVVGMTHPYPLIRDSSKCLYFNSKFPVFPKPKVDDLLQHFMGMTPKQPHRTVKEAQAMLDLYFKYKTVWENELENLL